MQLPADYRLLPKALFSPWPTPPPFTPPSLLSSTTPKQAN